MTVTKPIDEKFPILLKREIDGSRTEGFEVDVFTEGLYVKFPLGTLQSICKVSDLMLIEYESFVMECKL